MQENVRFFDVKLHKNVYFSVCKVHKIAKSVISIGQIGPSKIVKQIYKTAHGRVQKETWQLRQNLKKCTVIYGTITGPSPF